MAMSEYYNYQWDHKGRSNHFEQRKPQFNINDPIDRNLALNGLKDMIGASVDFALKDKSCVQDDEFLYRFLFARKFIVTESFKLIINYLEYKQRNSDTIQKLSALDEDIQLALRDGFPGVIPERDRRGRTVLIFLASNWNPNSYSLITIYRAMLLSLEKLLEDMQNQANGFVVIVDWTHFTLKQSSYLKPKILKIIIEGLQDCFPIKFKAIHFIGQPWYVEVAMAVIRPFLKEKTRERIFLHGGNLSTLHDCIAKDILPTELGGEGPSLNPLNWVHTLMEWSQTYCEKYQSYKLTQPIIYSKPPENYLKDSYISEK